MIIATEMTAPMRLTSGPAITHAGDLAAILSGLNDGDVLFVRSEEHTSELQSPVHLVCRLLLEKKKKKYNSIHLPTTSKSTPTPPPHARRCSHKQRSSA